VHASTAKQLHSVNAPYDASSVEQRATPCLRRLSLRTIHLGIPEEANGHDAPEQKVVRVTREQIESTQLAIKWDGGEDKIDPG
jgi:hypothetical protein